MDNKDWPKTITWCAFEDKLVLATSLALAVSETLSKSIAEKGKAMLVVSGGSTPKLFFKALAEQPISWDKVTITLADERFVDATHPDSNERLVREHLLVGKAASAKFMSLYHDVTTVSEAAEISHQVFKDNVMTPDVAVLGMGNDGHTASLFPGSPLLEQALDPNGEALCLPMKPQDAPYERITLTLPMLVKSTETFLHVVGEDKKVTLLRACDTEDEKEMPIWAFLKQPIKVFWSQ